MDIWLLNSLTGDRLIQVRQIRERVRAMPVSAHLVVQGNRAEGGSLGLARDDDTGAAWRDRIRCLRLETIEKPDRALIDRLDDPAFRTRL